jgi:hypothetical protein
MRKEKMGQKRGKGYSNCTNTENYAAVVRYSIILLHS